MYKFHNVILFSCNRNIVLPIFRENEEKIDEAVRKGQQKLTEIAEKVLPEKQE